MNKDSAIELHEVCKSFNLEIKTNEKNWLGIEKTDTLKNQVLKNVSFAINKGDVVGVIGRNGSGKSTLLKIISHIMAPDSGKVEVNGKIASILELGMGFHPDMSGRENIYLKGELYGFSKNTIDSKLDSIIEYSGLKKYIDNPVRTYSSGMTGRLAFSIMVNVDAEILLVDEILSVGDVTFASKAREHFKKLSSSGHTVIFVSHSLDSINQMCNRAIWIEDGKILKDGPVKDVTAAYQRQMNESYDIVSDMAEYGVPDAQYNLALMYREGHNVPQNNEFSFEWMKKAADQGHTKAQVELANMMMEKGGADNMNGALEFYRAAANKGDTEAKTKIAYYSSEIGTNPVVSELIEIYRQLAPRGSPVDEYRYADLLLKTAVTQKDKEKSLLWYRKSADHGNVDAMFQLATMYRDGTGTKKDLGEMINLLETASSLGHQRSQMYLADLYLSGKIIERDEKKSFGWYLEAAKGGNAKAQYQIAVMFQDGTGVERDLEQSKKWFETFAMSSFLPHLNAAAEILKYIPIDTGESTISLYKKSAEYCNTSACTQLGAIYRDGILSTTDPEKSKFYFERAAMVWGYSKYGLADLSYRGVEGCDFQKAAELFSQLAALGDPNASFRLANMYRYGKGVEKNDEECRRYLFIAAEKGNRDAIVLLEEYRMK